MKGKRTGRSEREEKRGRGISSRKPARINNCKVLNPKEEEKKEEECQAGRTGPTLQEVTPTADTHRLTLTLRLTCIIRDSDTHTVVFLFVLLYSTLPSSVRMMTPTTSISTTTSS
jgi:hypothetical protein